jgi:hypothetical protein
LTVRGNTARHHSRKCGNDRNRRSRCHELLRWRVFGKCGYRFSE